MVTPRTSRTAAGFTRGLVLFGLDQRQDRDDQAEDRRQAEELERERALEDLGNLPRLLVGHQGESHDESDETDASLRLAERRLGGAHDAGDRGDREARERAVDDQTTTGEIFEVEELRSPRWNEARNEPDDAKRPYAE